MPEMGGASALNFVYTGHGSISGGYVANEPEFEGIGGGLLGYGSEPGARARAGASAASASYLATIQAIDARKAQAVVGAEAAAQQSLSLPSEFDMAHSSSAVSLQPLMSQSDVSIGTAGSVQIGELAAHGSMGVAMAGAGAILVYTGAAEFGHASHAIGVGLRTAGLLGAAAPVVMFGEAFVLIPLGVTLAFTGGIVIGVAINDYALAPAFGVSTVSEFWGL